MPQHATSSRCPYCGDPEYAALAEVWDNGEFLVETCCSGLLSQLQELDSDGWRGLLQELEVEALTGHQLRRVLAGEPTLLLDFKLEIHSVTLKAAKDFVRAYHAHHPAPAGWRFGAAIWNGLQCIGVVMVGRPVARMIDASQVVEVNRLCLRRDLPEGLRWNACSQLYGWAAREARRRGFKRIITYTLETESGVSLRAAGWAQGGLTQGGSWSRSSRIRIDKAPVMRKVRWQKSLA